MTLTSRAELKPHPGRRDDFIVAAKALAAAAADEPGTLRYEWYADGEDSFVAIEEYVDAAAAFAHNANCEHLLTRAFELADLTGLQLHGEITPELQAFAENLPVARTYRPLT
jgi:quinol monooxygenase YgiN